MENAFDLRRLYAALADAYAERGQAQFRDRFLILAADAAHTGGDPGAAEHYRLRLLAENPHHLLRPFGSFSEAMQSPDVRAYVHDLRRDYPPDVARELQRSFQPAPQPAGGEPVPVKAPLLYLGGEPDLLTADENEPLRIFTYKDDKPSAIPPTLSPEQFSPIPPAAAPRREIPPTLYDVNPAPVPPPLPVNRPAPPPRPVASGAPGPRAHSARAFPVSSPRPAPQSEPAGAWVASLLFALVAAAAVALTGYALLSPLNGPRLWNR
jgi:hypothetical protein